MHKKSSLLVLGGLTFGTAAIGMALVNPGVMAADQGSTTASVTVDTVCSMTATVNSAHTVTLSSGTYSGTANPDGIGETSIETFCNDQDGYAIYAVGYTDNVLGNNKLIGAGLGSSADIITGTATGPNGNNDISNWAMKVSAGAGTDAPSILNGFSSFSAVPSSYTKVASLDHATTSSILKTTYAAYISATQPAGTYTGQVKYVLVNPNTAAAPNYMQEVDSTKLAQLMPSDGSTAILTDSRDGNKYQVTNIDGTYWMTDNLKIMGTISASESNFTGADFNISAGGDLTAGNTYTEPRAHFNTSDPNSATYGAHYNYCAASAGTVCSQTKQDATSDICPKGWRLPTQNEALVFKYASSPNKNPVLAGYYFIGSLFAASSRGDWWSATASNTTYQHTLYYDSGWYVGAYPKVFGYSVRCVYGPLPPTTMQNVTSTKLAELMPTDGSTTTLPDSRDGNVYNIARIGDIYWMTDNLRFTDTSLTPADTNVTQNTTMSYFDLKSSTGNSDTSLNSYTSAGIHYDTTDANSTTYGTYYNYCAASAGTVCSNSVQQDATSDICPKGWRLPTQTEANNFISASSSNKNPVLAGAYSGGKLYGASSYSFWWLTTAFNTGNQYNLRYGGSSWSMNNSTRVQGNLVRCVRSL